MVRVVIREVRLGAPTPSPAYYREFDDGQTVTIGREADLALGLGSVTAAIAADKAVSRVALQITPGPGGWIVRCSNRHGAFVHGWGQAPRRLDANEALRQAWPRTGIRVVGGLRDVEHWVLVEADEFGRPGTGSTLRTTSGVGLGAVPDLAARETAPVVSGGVGKRYGVTATTSPTPPPLLTDAQLAAVTAVFSEHLAWPPRSAPLTKSLDSVARRLGIGPEAVRERLKTAQGKAEQLGARKQGSVTDPDYLYVLVHHDYLPSPPDHVDALPYR